MRTTMGFFGARRVGDIGEPIEAGLGRARGDRPRSAPWPTARGGFLPHLTGVAWAERTKAPQAGSSRPAEEEEYDEAAPSYRYGRRSDNSKLLMVGGIAAVGLITLAIIVLSMGAGKPTLAELKQKIGIPPTATTVDIVMPQDVFYNKAGIPMEPPRSDPNYTYILYRVEEGVAQVAVDRVPWENQKARVREIRLIR